MVPVGPRGGGELGDPLVQIAEVERLPRHDLRARGAAAQPLRCPAASFRMLRQQGLLEHVEPTGRPQWVSRRSRPASPSDAASTAREARRPWAAKPKNATA
jgi:hypothetical protein